MNLREVDALVAQKVEDAEIDWRTSHDGNPDPIYVESQTPVPPFSTEDSIAITVLDENFGVFRVAKNGMSRPLEQRYRAEVWDGDKVMDVVGPSIALAACLAMLKCKGVDISKL